MSRVQATTKHLEVMGDDSSDSPLSEPQQSRPSPSQQLRSHKNDDAHQDAANYPNSTSKRNAHGVEKYSTSPPATTSTRHSTNSKSQPQSQTSAKIDEKSKATKRPRKKAAIEEVNINEKKEKPARKPRAAAAVATKPVRKKAKLDHHTATSAQVQASTSDYSTTITSPKTSLPAPSPDYSIRSHDQSRLDAPNVPSQQIHQTPPAITAPRMSYDPVRSMMVEIDPSPKTYSTAPPPALSGPATPSKIVASRPSLSPASISNIIDPPTDSQQQMQTIGRLTPKDSPAGAGDLAASQLDGAAQYSINRDHARVPSSTVPSKAPSPKPARSKEAPPPPPQGSGLLTAALFGPSTNGATTASEQAPSIIVHVKLAQSDNNIINFAQIAEEKYGFAALHPRLAAQKERLARVAAAGAILEKSAPSRAGRTSTGESGDDDVSVDIDRDSENDGDLATTNANGGGTGANSGTDATGSKVTRKKRKGEGYDADDPFVDDSELAWEAQAAAVKDGFFVYAGPLVPEAEKAVVERADGTVKRGRGRGRGGGPGSRGGRGGAAAGAAASGDGGSGTGRGGGGPGSRGGTSRRARGTKNARTLPEREKPAVEPERMAPLAAKPTTLPNPA